MMPNQAIEPAGIKPLEILVANDNPDDIRLIPDAFSLWKGSRRVQVFLNGAGALVHFENRQQGNHPDLILLDWNLPGINGEQVLEHLKDDQSLKKIPVVIFTSSSAPAHRLKAIGLGADGFVTKPLDIDDFFNVIADVEEFVSARGR